MAPIRRYLRISKSSVLECRIFPENPADGPRWLLASDNPALPRIIEAARPMILDALREEQDKSRDKGKKKKRFKSDLEKDDFKATIFFAPVAARHAALLANRDIESQTGEGALADSTVDPITIREESEDEDVLIAQPTPGDATEYADDKKSFGFRTTYQGFSIWGSTLYVLVDRKGGTNKKSQAGSGKGQGLMEEWMSTQEQAADISALM